MKTISLWQPWASLMAFGLKGIETRSWPFSYPTPAVVAFHARANWNRNLHRQCKVEPFHSALRDSGVYYSRGYRQRLLKPLIPFGAVVAIGRVAKCLPIVAPGKPPRELDCVALDDEGIVRVWRWTHL